MIFHSFTVSNFRSIKEPLTLTMEAADVPGPSQEIDDRNLVQGPDGKYLKVKALYGGNAAGKSNIFKALANFQLIIREIGSASFDLSKYIQPFQLNRESRHEDTFFEITLSNKDLTYRYGFEANSKEITNEWLFIKDEKGVEDLGFEYSSKYENYDIGPVYFKESHDEFKRLLNQEVKEEGNVDEFNKEEYFENYPYEFSSPTLFLQGLNKDNELIASQLIVLILGAIRPFNALTPGGLKEPEIVRLTSPGTTKTFILNLLKYADVNILDFDRQPIVGPEGEEFQAIVILKATFDNKGKRNGEESFNLNQESDGTKKLFTLGRSLEFILSIGGTMWIDELDARFHPLLTSMIVELFQNPETNPKGAQLIFITHDTQFLSLKRFRPDQIAFVSRNKGNATEISHLIEFEGIESDSDIRDLYMKGLLDGVPNLNLFLESFKKS